MTSKPSINDLDRFDLSHRVGRQQLWNAFVDDWEVDRDLADWVISTLAAREASLHEAEKQIAAQDAELEELRPLETD